MKTSKFKMTEIGEIPADWEVKRLGNLMSFKNGYNADAKCYGKGVLFASVLDALSNVPATSENIRGRVAAPQKAIEDFSLKFGDLIFTRSSETLEDVGRANVYLDKNQSSMFGGFVIRGRPIADFDSVFLNYILRERSHRQRVIVKGAGAQHFNIGQIGLADVAVVMPPLAEQKAIAEALSDVDALIAAQEELIEKKRAIKQGAMQDLLTSKKRLPGFGGAWVEKRLGDCGKLSRESINPQMFPSRLFFDFSMPNFDDGKQAQVVRGIQLQSAKTPMHGKVLLFNKLNVRQKRIWFVEDCPMNSICSSEFLPFYSESIDLEFLSYYLSTDKSTNDFIECSTGTSNSQKRITPSDFLDYLVALPPLTEQKAIAEVLSDMDAEISELEAQKAKFESIKQGMMQELLTGKIRLKGA